MSRRWIFLAYIFSMLCMQAECWSYQRSGRRLTWDQARAWCREHRIDLVTMKNQEIDHLKMLLAPREARSYWIGIRKINNNWMRVGTNEPVTNANWEEGQPSNSGGNHDCVETWMGQYQNMEEWNNLQCDELNYALCYDASCQNDSCVHGDCVETVPGHRCQCTEGFDGDQCQNAVECSELTPPPKGDFSCTGKDGDFAFDSLCQFSCEVGYELSHSDPLRCTATKNWSHPPPTCEAVECSELTPPPKGNFSCTDMDGDFTFDPATRFSYGNNCTFSCQDGFKLRGVVSMACTHSGEWNAPPPTCEEYASDLSAIVASVTIGGVVALSALPLLVCILLYRRREPADDLVMINHFRH